MKALHFPSLRTDGLIGILGLGETGLSAAQWCLDGGARVRLLDTREQMDIRSQLEGDLSQVEIVLGDLALRAEALQDIRMLVISPGLSPLQTEIAQFLQWAQEQGIELVNEIELFARALEDLRAQGHEARVLAVTGTNGKTTVVSLLAHVLRAAGLTVCAAGNISPAALTALRDCLRAGQLPQVWLIELSSFQLVYTNSLRCDAATVLNISQDHLDWHGSMSAYVQAKAKLFELSRVQVFNRDDTQVVGMLANPNALSTRGFSAHAPERAGDLGLVLEAGLWWLSAMDKVEPELPSSSRKAPSSVVASEAQRVSGPVNKLMPAEALQIKGRHNALNALAVLALARELGLGWSELLHALRSYTGEPHRLQLVRVMQGVSYFDDSKGTNVGATVAALNGLEQPLILIAGGLAKGQDFSPLAQLMSPKVKAVLLMGQDAALLADALANTGVPLLLQSTLEQAVATAVEMAVQGDAVVLSPACASMDMFRNYQHRGECFVSALTDIALDKGEAA